MPNKSTYAFDYEPIECDTLIQLLDRLKQKMILLGYDKHVFKNYDKMKYQLTKIYDFADKSSCGYIRANGYFSIFKLIFRIMARIENDLLQSDSMKKKKAFENFNPVLNLIMRFIEIANNLIDDTNLDSEEKERSHKRMLLEYPEFCSKLKMYQKLIITKRDFNNNIINNNLIESLSDIRLNNISKKINDSFSQTANGQNFYSMPLFTPNLTTIFDSIYEGIYQPTTKNREVIFRDYAMCWINKETALFFIIFKNVLPFLRAHLYQYFRLIFDKTYRNEMYNKFLRWPTITFPFSVWDLSDHWIALIIIKYLTRKSQTNSIKVLVPSQKTIQINSSPVERLTINNKDQIIFNNERKIQTNYISPQNVDLTKSERLVLHFHGGGFMSQGCDSYEIVLRRWVNFNKLPILTVNYRVKRPFPIALQDCFDVYIWLRKAPIKDVKSILKFYPKTIVIVGDSAGGNLCLGVSLVLNDLRTDYKSKFKIEIQMPNGLMPIYSVFLISTALCPSRILSVFDGIVSLGVQMIILHAVLGFLPNLKPNTTFEELKLFFFPSLDQKAWFDCPREIFKERVEFFAKYLPSPYITSLYYDKFETLNDVPIHLIAAEYCTFLDESITLAKIWKGPLKIDVIPDISHAFLNTSLETNDASATIFCAQQIEKMFN